MHLRVETVQARSTIRRVLAPITQLPLTGYDKEGETQQEGAEHRQMMRPNLMHVQHRPAQRRAARAVAHSRPAWS